MRIKNIITLTLIATVCGFSNISCSVNKAADTPTEQPTSTKKLTATDIRIERARELTTKSPNEIKGHLELADALLTKVRETGDYSFNKEAMESISKVLKREPDNLNANVFKIQIDLSEHEFQRALNTAERMLEKFPNVEPLMAAEVDAKTELGMFKEAVVAAQKYVDFKPNSNSYVRIARLRYLHGDVEGAIQARKLGLKSADPSNKEGLAWHYSQLGNEYFETGMYDLAEAQYLKALDVFPEFHWALAGKGRVRAAKGDLKTAEDIYRKLVKVTAEADRVFFLADVLEKRGKKAESRQVAETFIQNQLNSDGDIHRIALYWADKNTNLERALKIATEDRKENGDLLSSDTLAWTLFKNGRVKEAQKYIQEAMRLGTKNALFYYHAGMIEEALGNKQKARTYLEKAAKTNPGFDLIQSDLLNEKLEELRKEV